MALAPATWNHSVARGEEVMDHRVVHRESESKLPTQSAREGGVANEDDAVQPKSLLDGVPLDWSSREMD